MLAFSWLYSFHSTFAGKGKGMFSQTAFGVSAESFSYKVIAACLDADPLCATRHNILFTRSVLPNHLVKHFCFCFVLGSWQKKERRKQKNKRRSKEKVRRKEEEKEEGDTT